MEPSFAKSSTSMIDAIGEMFAICGSADAVLPATLLYEEGWMLRLVLKWAALHPTSVPSLQFLPGSKWYSEALIASPFPPRKRGDNQADGETHADGVIG